MSNEEIGTDEPHDVRRARREGFAAGAASVQATAAAEKAAYVEAAKASIAQLQERANEKRAHAVSVERTNVAAALERRLGELEAAGAQAPLYALALRDLAAALRARS